MAARARAEPPLGFRIDRRAAVGRHKLTEVFSGLHEVPPFSQLPGSRRGNLRLLRNAWVAIVDDETWMYVAPRAAPHWAGEVGWTPVTHRGDCIVVGRAHLRTSVPMILYLDILHEFRHLLQRRDGADLWDMTKGYVGSPTELQAYRFAVREARRLGVTDGFLRRYLKVEWVSRPDHARLLRSLKVPIR